MWNNWKQALSKRKFLLRFVLALAGLILFAVSLPHFFNEVLQPKPGVQWNDPVLIFFEPRDWSVEIFILIYSSTVLSLAFNFQKPKTILTGLQTYVIVNFLRMTSLYLFTLEAPEGIIALRDPFLTVFAYGKEIFVKDLFFSGHISTLFLLVLIEERLWLKYTVIATTTVVAVLLAWQRVHYTLDMLAAPVITWLVWKLIKGSNSALQ